MFWSVGGLFAYHQYLTAIALTTHEEMKCMSLTHTLSSSPSLLIRLLPIAYIPSTHPLTHLAFGYYFNLPVSLFYLQSLVLHQLWCIYFHHPISFVNHFDWLSFMNWLLSIIQPSLTFGACCSQSLLFCQPVALPSPVASPLTMVSINTFHPSYLWMFMQLLLPAITHLSCVFIQQVSPSHLHLHLHPLLWPASPSFSPSCPLLPSSSPFSLISPSCLYPLSVCKSSSSNSGHLQLHS